MSKTGPGKKAPADGLTKAIDPQMAAFEQAVHLFHNREFAAAMPLFAEAAKGSNLDIGQTAHLHARMCQQRLGTMPQPSLATAEDYYSYGLALTNQRKLAEAEKALLTATELAPGADHIHYALALARGLQNNYRGAAESLFRAIELQPANRSAARADADFHEALQHSPLRELVYSEKIAGR
jgi:tetratricopeptide (TPR) repeat protein